MNQAYESASFVRCVVPETADIQAASAAVAANPESGDAWMQKGHALAKVSMMREAEECYAMAISCDPFNWEYYRHRAHRFLSCWRFEDAAADFVIASRLNPNDWNVFYHLGLSYFLLRDYAKAAKAYARCYELTDADPELIAVTDWYYMTLKRLGNDEEAAKILARITVAMGGRAAETVALDDICTGASNDIEQATKLARAMITRYGMSEEFDMVAMETVTNQYLGGDTSLACSADTQNRIDAKVVELVKAQHQKAKNILLENREKLDELAKYLYEKETITGEEFMRILGQEGKAQ